MAVRDAGGDAPHQRRPVRRRPGQRHDGGRSGATWSAALVYAGRPGPGPGAPGHSDRWPETRRGHRAEHARRPGRGGRRTCSAAAVGSFGLTAFALRFGPRRRLPGVVVLDPQAPVPSGGIDGPEPTPAVTAAPVPPGRRGAPPRQRRRAERATRSCPAAAAPARRGTRTARLLPSGRRPGSWPSPSRATTDFYIVTKNAGGRPGRCDADDWRLRIDGEVGRPVELDYASLRSLPAVEVTKTLECISNFVAKCELAPFGCDLITTARWKGRAGAATCWPWPGGARPGAVSLATFSRRRVHHRPAHGGGAGPRRRCWCTR